MFRVNLERLGKLSKIQTETVMRFQHWIETAGPADLAIVLGGGASVLWDILFEMNPGKSEVLCRGALAAEIAEAANARYRNAPRVSALRALPRDLERAAEEAGRGGQAVPLVVPAAELAGHVRDQTETWRRVAEVVAGYPPPAARLARVAAEEVEAAASRALRRASRPVILQAPAEMAEARVLQPDRLTGATLFESGREDEDPPWSAGAAAPRPTPTMVAAFARYLAGAEDRDITAMVGQLPPAARAAVVAGWRDDLLGSSTVGEAEMFGADAPHRLRAALTRLDALDPDGAPRAISA